MTITDKQVEAAIAAEEAAAQRLTANGEICGLALTMRAALEAAEAAREPYACQACGRCGVPAPGAPEADERDTIAESAMIVREILGPGGGLRCDANLVDMLRTLQCVVAARAAIDRAMGGVGGE